MTDQNGHSTDPQAAAEAAAAGAPAADPAALAKEAADYKDRLLRTLAEMENLRRRTERELMKVMEKHGIKRFDPQGQKFDPNLHQAMFEVPDAKVPSGFVVQVIQPGYMIADRVLRPALVGVSKGGPRAAPTPTASGAAAGEAGK